MKTKDYRPVIFLIIIGLIYCGYLAFVGYALHDLRWNNGWSFLTAFGVGIIVILFVAALLFVVIFLNQKSQTIKGSTLGLTLGLVFVIPLVGLVTYRVQDVRDYREHYTFTTTKWAEADANERGRLIDSFRKTYDIIGYELEEVTALLGTPDYTERNYISYNIGEYRSLLAIDPFMYLIEIDNDQIVINESIFIT